MNDLTQILCAIHEGNLLAADQLLPLVYEELRRLAGAKMAQEAPGHTLQATALVHDAYVRLVDNDKAQEWNSRGHFFAAAAEAMRRILIEKARGKARLKHGGGRQRVDLDNVGDAGMTGADELLALDEALGRLEQADPEAAKLVKLRYFAGLTMTEVADSLGISLRSAERNWTFARTWLHRELLKPS